MWYISKRVAHSLTERTAILIVFSWLLLACEPPIIAAARDGNLAKVKIQVEAGHSVETQDDVNLTPLFYAISHSHYEVAEYLITKGASIKGNHFNGTIPIIIASYQSDPRIIELLINHHADINEKTKDGLTALWFLLCKDVEEQKPMSPVKLDVLALLLKHGAEVNVSGKEPLYLTPLHCAADRGDADAVRMLLEKGANLDAVDGRGRKSEVLARDKGFTAVVEVLTHKQALSSESHPISSLRCEDRLRNFSDSDEWKTEFSRVFIFIREVSAKKLAPLGLAKGEQAIRNDPRVMGMARNFASGIFHILRKDINSAIPCLRLALQTEYFTIDDLTVFGSKTPRLIDDPNWRTLLSKMKE